MTVMTRTTNFQSRFLSPIFALPFLAYTIGFYAIYCEEKNQIKATRSRRQSVFKRSFFYISKSILSISDLSHKPIVIYTISFYYSPNSDKLTTTERGIFLKFKACHRLGLFSNNLR